MKRLLVVVTLVIMAAFTFVMTPDSAEAVTTTGATIKCHFIFTFPTEKKVCNNLDSSIDKFTTSYNNLSTNDVKVEADAGSCPKDIRTIPKLTEDDTKSYKCGNVIGAIFTHLEKKGKIEVTVTQ